MPKSQFLEKCVRAVKKKQPKVCKVRGYPRRTKVGKKTIKCFNPWAICRSVQKSMKKSLK